MLYTVYFGHRFHEFCNAVGDIKVGYTDSLSPNLTADIIVIDAPTNPNFTIPVGTIGVVSSDNLSGLACLMKSGVRTVTCGMSYRDTVTLSSNQSSTTVCLQRRLPSIVGKIFEPAEFPIRQQCNPDCLLLASAVRLLCGFEPK